MKRAIATLTATGVLTVATLVGGAASAGAATPAPAPAPAPAHAAAVAANPIGSYGPFGSAQECTQYVADYGNLGFWDCEYAQHNWYAFSPNAGHVAIDSWGPFGSAQECISWVGSINKLGVFDCEYALTKWYAFAPV